MPITSDPIARSCMRGTRGTVELLVGDDAELRVMAGQRQGWFDGYCDHGEALGVGPVAPAAPADAGG